MTATPRKARLADVPPMQALLATFAHQELLLPRTKGELYENLRDFWVVDAPDGGLLGCAGLHIVSGTIAEVKSLAVSPKAQGQGVGKQLVLAVVDEAAALGLQKVFCLTYQEAFFGRCGFVRVDRSRLPEKVWRECVRCSRFLACDEISMWRDTDPTAALPTTDAG